MCHIGILMSNFPDFICVGVQKSETTTLHDILSQDKQIYLPKIIETI
jgi:hypothetical protein